MKPTRRHFALSSVALVLASEAVKAQGTDDAAVTEAVEALRQGMLNPDKSRLESLLADQLSYGHSSGRLETKAQFVDSLVNKKSVFKNITVSDQTVVVVGSNAIVRHLFTGETVSGEKITPVKIGILQVWVKQDGAWKLLARQAVPVQPG